MGYINENIGPVYALLGVIITIIVNSIIQKSKSKIDHLVSDRTILSQDQENFKNSIILQLKECNNTVDRLQIDISNWQTKYLSGQEQKAALSDEILSLKHKLAELSERIKHMEQGKKEPV